MDPVLCHYLNNPQEFWALDPERLYTQFYMLPIRNLSDEEASRLFRSSVVNNLIMYVTRDLYPISRESIYETLNRLNFLVNLLKPQENKNRVFDAIFTILSNNPQFVEEENLYMSMYYNRLMELAGNYPRAREFYNYLFPSSHIKRDREMEGLEGMESRKRR